MTVQSSKSPPMRQLWFSLLSGVIVWSLHLLSVYAVTSLTCVWGWFDFTLFGLTGLRVVQLGVTVVAALIVAAAGLLAAQNWRRLRLSDDVISDIISESTEARFSFLAFLGMALNALFFVIIVLSALPILTIAACPGG